MAPEMWCSAVRWHTAHIRTHKRPSFQEPETKHPAAAVRMPTTAMLLTGEQRHLCHFQPGTTEEGAWHLVSTKASGAHLLI